MARLPLTNVALTDGTHRCSRAVTDSCVRRNRTSLRVWLNMVVAPALGKALVRVKTIERSQSSGCSLCSALQPETCSSPGYPELRRGRGTVTGVFCLLTVLTVPLYQD